MSIAITEEKAETPQPMSVEKVKELITKEGLTLTAVLDAVVELNGFVGVGLITLGDICRAHLEKRIKNTL